MHYSTVHMLILETLNHVDLHYFINLPSISGCTIIDHMHPGSSKFHNYSGPTNIISVFPGQMETFEAQRSVFETKVAWRPLFVRLQHSNVDGFVKNADLCHLDRTPLTHDTIRSRA